MRQGRYVPKDAYGVRPDGERYQLDGQPPVAQPTRRGRPLVVVARSNAAALEEAWREMAEALDQ